MSPAFISRHTIYRDRIGDDGSRDRRTYGRPVRSAVLTRTSKHISANTTLQLVAAERSRIRAADGKRLSQRRHNSRSQPAVVGGSLPSRRRRRRVRRRTHRTLKAKGVNGKGDLLSRFGRRIQGRRRTIRFKSTYGNWFFGDLGVSERSRAGTRRRAFMSGRLRATTSAERDDMTDERKPDDTDAQITEDRTIDQQIELGEIDDVLDPWLAEHADDYTGTECPRCGTRLYNDSHVISEHHRRYKHRSKAPQGVACYCLPCGLERKRITDERTTPTLADLGDFASGQGGAGE